jgi:hypothetical protein
MDGEQLLLYLTSRKCQRYPVANALIHPHNRNKPEYGSRQQTDSWFPVGRAISHSFQKRPFVGAIQSTAAPLER